MSFARPAVAFVLMLGSSAAASADDGRTIVQQGRAFRPLEVTINQGDSLVFSNQDAFIHQVYVKSDTLNFDTDEQQPGQNISVKFPISGTFEVRCHIHPKMTLTVHVK